MTTYKFFDRADEFRIEIVGRLAGPGVQEVRQAWEGALGEPTPRRFCVDISRLSGYDVSARNLMAEMYRHGTEFAARTPSSLVFLNEIANTPRTPALVVSAPVRKRENKTVRETVGGMAAGH